MDFVHHPETLYANNLNEQIGLNWAKSGKSFDRKLATQQNSVTTAFTPYIRKFIRTHCYRINEFLVALRSEHGYICIIMAISIMQQERTLEHQYQSF